MLNEPHQATTGSMPPEATVLLQRLMNALERQERKRWVEIGSAVLLSLAAVGSAWCAYQANRWGGVQTFRLAAVGKADRAAVEHQIAALQFRSFDASMLITYLQARVAVDQKLADLLYPRFRPEMKVALDAWLKTDPFNNPAAPSSPFAMTEYIQAEGQYARSQHQAAEEQLAAANYANRTSDTYVLLTVLFAIVLFFGGIAGTFRSHRLQMVAASIALMLFLATVVFLAAMPICRG